MPNEILDDFHAPSKPPKKRNFKPFYKRLKIWAVYIIISIIISGFYSLTEVQQEFFPVDSFDPDEINMLTGLIAISILSSALIVEFIWEDGRRPQKVLKLSLAAILFVAQAAWSSLGPCNYLEALEQLTPAPPVHFLMAWTVPVIIIIEVLTAIFQLFAKNKPSRSTAED